MTICLQTSLVYYFNVVRSEAGESEFPEATCLIAPNVNRVADVERIPFLVRGSNHLVETTSSDLLRMLLYSYG